MLFEILHMPMTAFHAKLQSLVYDPLTSFKTMLCNSRHPSRHADIKRNWKIVHGL